MSTIIAGGFQVQAEAEEAVRRLQDAGIHIDYICTFRVNPAGEHHRLAAGGDHDSSPGSEHAQSGAVKGAAIGTAVGLAAGAAAAPFVGPAGFAIAAAAGVGAYTGALVGSLNEIGHEPAPDHGDVRPAENMVAVNADASGASEEVIVHTLEECGAQLVERAQGTWTEDAWADFDPTSRPLLIGGREFARLPDEGQRPRT
jgi:hypothetical protein